MVLTAYFFTDGDAANRVSRTFIEQLNNEFRKSWDSFFTLCPPLACDFWAHVTERCERIDNAAFANVATSLGLSDLASPPTMNLYAVEYDRDRLLIVAVPERSDDLLAFVPKNVTLGNRSRLINFPVFVFNVHFPAVVRRLLPENDEESGIKKDIVLDFTQSDESESVLSVMHRQISKLSDIDDSIDLDSLYSDEPDEDVADAALKTGEQQIWDHFDLADFCQNMEHSQYSKAFVQCVYDCLSDDTPVPRSDILNAIDGKCEEHVMHIEMTEFMEVLCKHLESVTFDLAVEQGTKKYRRIDVSDTNANVSFS